jgi:hypothetical protein
MSSVTVVPETSVSVKNLLYDQWDTGLTPNKDVFPETFVPNLIHFTSRYWATNPERIHNYQISVLAGPKKDAPEEVGSVVMYKVEEQLEIHVWAVAGIGDDYETVEQNLQTMLRQIDYILRNNAATQAISGIQFIRIAPGTKPMDMIKHARILHRTVEVTAVYYRTEVPAFEFVLSISPATISLLAGQGTTATITLVTAVSPISNPVVFALSVSPAQLTINPSINLLSLILGSTIGSSATNILGVTTTNLTPVGVYAIVIKATSGTRSHTDTLVVTIGTSTTKTFNYDDGTIYDGTGTFGVYG